MSEFRFDRFRGDTVLLAPSRQTVPGSAPSEAFLPAPSGPCPFCPGGASDDDPTLAFWPDPLTPNEWDVRVVANRYPAADAHEVIIESREHHSDLVDWAPAKLARVLRAYRARVATLETDAEGVVHLFRNRGVRAGSSQPHPHAQAMRTALTPDGEQRWSLANEHFSRTGTPLSTDYLLEELTAESRIVHATESVVVLCPWAPRFNFETWIVAREAGSFSGASDETLDAVASVLGATLRRILASSGRRAYNLVFRMPPIAHRRHPAGFWILEILPRHGPGAGYELSAGAALVAVPPEQAAEILRKNP